MSKGVAQLLGSLTVAGEILKSTDAVKDYTIETDMENISVAPDGVLEYDLIVDVTIQPKCAVEHINVNFKVV